MFQRGVFNDAVKEVKKSRGPLGAAKADKKEEKVINLISASYRPGGGKKRYAPNGGFDFHKQA